MALNLIKLCVGAESIADLQEWIALRLRISGEQIHTTRMMPKSRAEILAGGSLFWVIKGIVSCRQRILDLRGRRDADGISRCDIVLDPKLVTVDPRPRGPFQGWRYLSAADAPPDLAGAGTPDAEMPLELQQQLRAMGLV